MSEVAEQLKSALAALPQSDRAELAQFLLASLDDPGEPLTPEEVDASWLPELNRRFAEVESGKAPALPIDELLRRMREKYS